MNTNRQKIIKALKQAEVGLSISGVSREADVCRDTATRWLNKLEREGVISFTHIGSAKLYILRQETKK